ncbi:MAG: VWA domain-containing protein [Fimbriimonadaceae bacterium]|nr:VWA domain-containing protein [Fimbriimonadaceae bacterium]
MYRFRYSRWDPSLFEELQRFKGLLQLFNFLLLKTDGNVAQTIDWMRTLLRRGLLQRLGLAETEAELEAFFAELRRQEYVREDPSGSGELTLAARGERGLRRDALKLIFDGLQKGGVGDHPVVWDGLGQDPLPELRPFEWGDDLRSIDFNRSFQNAMRRGGLTLSEEDLEVRATETSTSCATALLVDVSHSMTLYGEDRITPAKQVALALSELILTEFPRDKLTIILFGDDARVVDVADLPYLSNGPYHTNTKAGLRAAREILMRQKTGNKQIFMITDGKPSLIFESDGTVYRNSFGLDPRIVNQTLDEAVVCRQRRIPITTFMVASDPYLQQFVMQLTELNHGRAYLSSSDQLGSYVFADFMRNRRRTI